MQQDRKAQVPFSASRKPIHVSIYLIVQMIRTGLILASDRTAIAFGELVTIPEWFPGKLSLLGVIPICVLKSIHYG